MKNDVCDISKLRRSEKEISKQQLKDYYLKKNNQKIKID